MPRLRLFFGLLLGRVSRRGPVQSVEFTLVFSKGQHKAGKFGSHFGSLLSTNWIPLKRGWRLKEAQGAPFLGLGSYRTRA